MSVKDRYTVIGHPIAHSQSPRIHALFAKQTGESLSYDATDVPPAELARSFKAFFAHGGKGMNVTVPHKERVKSLVDKLSARARLAGAVNTVAKLSSGELLGDNTDGEGLVTDLVDNLCADLEEARILILGAGGATRGIVPALLRAAPQLITISNRTARTAHELAEHFDKDGTVVGCGYDELPIKAYDIVIHATSAGLAGELPEFPDTVIGAYSFCYDLSYAASDTPFVAKAKSLGCETSYDGLGMLVEQAAAAFELWRGVRPATAPVIAALRKS
jgi:shikimate dehydrogenase